MPRRKKSSFLKSGSTGVIKEKPQQRSAANARERARMRVLSKAFHKLKTSLPWVPPDTKLSKLDTLRLAASYITHLKGILRQEPINSSTDEPFHPAMSMTWPFALNRIGGQSCETGNTLVGIDDSCNSEDQATSSDSDSGTWEDSSSLPSKSNSKECVHLDLSSPSLSLNCSHSSQLYPLKSRASSKTQVSALQHNNRQSENIPQYEFSASVNINGGSYGCLDEDSAYPLPVYGSRAPFHPEEVEVDRFEPRCTQYNNENFETPLCSQFGSAVNVMLLG